MIKLGLSIFEEEGAADDDLPPLDDAPVEDNTNAKMEEIDWVLVDSVGFAGWMFVWPTALWYLAQ